MCEWTGAIQDSHIRRNSLDDLLSPIAIDPKVPSEAAIKPMQAVDDQSHDADHIN
jgi:hypothetical protein